MFSNGDRCGVRGGSIGPLGTWSGRSAGMCRSVRMFAGCWDVSGRRDLSRAPGCVVSGQPAASSCSLTTRRSTLPMIERGSSGTATMLRGTL